MKKWIKRKLIKFLNIDSLEQRHENLLYDYRVLKEEIKYLTELNSKIIQQNENLIRQFNLSADIYHVHPQHSWAVISIQGKPEYVRFVNLSNQDMRSIHSFLKQFEKTNMTVDSPYQFFGKDW